MRHFHSGVPSSYKHITANATTQYADLRVYWEECIVLSSSSSESSPASCPPTHWSNFAFDFATIGSTMHAFTLNACGSVTSGARDTYASMITVPAIFQLPSASTRAVASILPTKPRFATWAMLVLLETTKTTVSLLSIRRHGAFESDSLRMRIHAAARSRRRDCCCGAIARASAFAEEMCMVSCTSLSTIPLICLAC